MENANQTVIVFAGVKYQFLFFDTDDPSKECTPDHTNDHITIVHPGDYLIVCSAVCLSSGGAGTVCEVEVMRNNGAARVGPLHVDRAMAGGGGDRGSMTLTGIATLAAGDTIEVWVENETNTQNYVFEDVALSVVQIGG